MRQIYDDIRKIWVAATPEEVVRQSWLKKMVCELGYPKELLVVEKELGELPHLFNQALPQRRLDILCYAKKEGLTPLLLLECKDGRLSQQALDQVMGYNHFIQAPFVGLININQAIVSGKSATWQLIPSYQELLTCKTPM